MGGIQSFHAAQGSPQAWCSISGDFFLVQVLEKRPVSKAFEAIQNKTFCLARQKTENKLSRGAEGSVGTAGGQVCHLGVGFCTQRALPVNITQKRWKWIKNFLSKKKINKIERNQPNQPTNQQKPQTKTFQVKVPTKHEPNLQMIFLASFPSSHETSFISK